jgi:hypothetical protein
MNDALRGLPKTIEYRGEVVVLRRPTVADLVAALDAESRGLQMSAWYVANHVLGPDRGPLYCYDEVMKLNAPAVVGLSREIEKLYTEGLD